VLAYRLFDRQNHEPAPQPGEEKCWPMSVIPDLDGNDLSLLKSPQPAATLFLVTAAQFLDLAKAKQKAPPGIENRALGAPARQCFIPSGEQRIYGFHHLRPALSAATVRTLFPT
jgi:hypothetical protein